MANNDPWIVRVATTKQQIKDRDTYTPNVKTLTVRGHLYLALTSDTSVACGQSQSTQSHCSRMHACALTINDRRLNRSNATNMGEESDVLEIL